MSMRYLINYYQSIDWQNKINLESQVLYCEMRYLNPKIHFKHLELLYWALCKVENAVMTTQPFVWAFRRLLLQALMFIVYNYLVF